MAGFCFPWGRDALSGSGPRGGEVPYPHTDAVIPRQGQSGAEWGVRNSPFGTSMFAPTGPGCVYRFPKGEHFDFAVCWEEVAFWSVFISAVHVVGV